jgi:hypothetical protein
MAARAKFIKASQTLRQKAVNHRTGLPLVLPPEMRSQIEGVIAASADSFATDILAKLIEMRQIIARLGKDELSRTFVLPNVQELAFDIKGMGGLFGYPLLTALGKSLNDFVTAQSMPSEAAFEIISIHIDAIYVLLAQHVTGEGGDTERVLMTTLASAVDKVSERDMMMAIN